MWVVWSIGALIGCLPAFVVLRNGAGGVSQQIEEDALRWGAPRLFYSRWARVALAGSFPADGEALFRDCEFKAAAKF